MNWITEAVAIGTSVEAQDVSVLRAGRFRSLLSLDGSLTESNAADLGLTEIVSVPLRDGSGNDLQTFQLAVKSLTRLAGSMAPVLVQCQFGRSRSPAVVAAYLMGLRGLDPFQAIQLVSAKRDISISAALLPFLFRLEVDHSSAPE